MENAQRGSESVIQPSNDANSTRLAIVYELFRKTGHLKDNPWATSVAIGQCIHLMMLSEQGKRGEVEQYMTRLEQGL
jgi:hypothetical protein